MELKNVSITTLQWNIKSVQPLKCRTVSTSFWTQSITMVFSDCFAFCMSLHGHTAAAAHVYILGTRPWNGWPQRNEWPSHCHLESFLQSWGLSTAALESLSTISCSSYSSWNEHHDSWGALGYQPPLNISVQTLPPIHRRPFPPFWGRGHGNLQRKFLLFMEHWP